MEVPTKLKSLYKHWGYHTSSPKIKSGETKLNEAILGKMGEFAVERMKIWEKKEGGQHPPYTKDPILRNYRFCNIYRELDRQTIEIHTQLKELEDNFPLWLLNLAFHRFVCRPKTVKKVGYLNFSSSNNKMVYKKLTEMASPKYGSAYVFPISIIQNTDFPTRESFFCFYLPKTIKKVSEELQSFQNVTVDEALKIILPKFGFNFRFHWTEVLIDISYQFPGKLNLYREFPIGPGALPTTKALNKNTDPTRVCDALVSQEIESFPYLKFQGKKVLLSAENWEGVACEFRKYTNLKKGKGRVRRYPK